MSPQPSEAGSKEDVLIDLYLAYLQAVDEGRPPDLPELLAAHPELRGLLDDQEAVAQQARPLRDAFRVVPAEPPEHCPPKLTNYESLRFLFRGGMGDVYQGWQCLPHREVAVKVIRAGSLAGDAERDRFLAEAQRAADLEHPNVVRIYEVGIVDGQPFFSMAYAAGGDLAGRVQEFRGKWVETAALLRTVALAVNFANRYGVLHRDLKPRNILLAADDTPLVADFGLAEPLRPGAVAGQAAPVGAAETADYGPAACASPTGDRASTASEMATVHQGTAGRIAGTPSYMAPEQARGERNLTLAVDTYGLGAVLYELLTGQPPFRGETIKETLKQVCEQAPVPPRQLDRHVPPDLEAICLKCLSKEPEKRYASAKELAEDLGRFLEGRPVEAPPGGRQVRLFLWSRRQPLAAALSALVLLLAVALLVGGGRWLWLLIDERERDQQRLYDKGVGRAKQFIDAGHLDQALEALDECPERLRGWDWHYLHNLCRQGKRLAGHEQAVQSVRYSPCGRYILTGGLDGTAILWDAKTGERVRTFKGHHGRVTAGFADNGGLVVTAGEEHSVLVHNAKNGEKVREFRDVGDRFACDARSRYVAVIDSKNQRLRLLDVIKMGDALVAEKNLGRFVVTLALDPEGRYLALGSFHHEVELLAIPSLKAKPLLKRTGTHETSWALAFSPDGKRLAASQGRPVLWSVKTGEVEAILQGTGNMHCNSLDFSPDSKHLVGTYRDGFVRVWDVDRGVMERGTALYGEMPNAAVFSPDRTALAVTSGKAVLIKPLVPRVETNRPLPGHRAGPIESVAFDPDGQTVASLAGNELLIHDLTEGKLIRRQEVRPPQGKLARCLKVLNSGKVLNYGVLIASSETHDGGPCVATWDSRDDSTVRMPVTHEVTSLALDGKGDLVWGDSTGQVHHWRTGTDAFETLRIGHGATVTALTVSSDGKRRIATGGMDLTVQIWQGEQRLAVLRGHIGSITCVAFSNDGERLISGGSDGLMKVWDVATGVELFDLAGHGGKLVSDLAFDANGWRLASCGDDRVVRIWDGSPKQR